MQCKVLEHTQARPAPVLVTGGTPRLRLLSVSGDELQPGVSGQVAQPPAKKNEDLTDQKRDIAESQGA